MTGIFKMRCELFLNEAYLRYGIKKHIIWDTDVAPHGAIFGTTGSGKTYAEKILLARISLKCPDCQFYICDFKGDSDFSFLAGTKRFYRYAECKKGFDDFYNCFLKRQSGQDSSRNFLLIVWEEWASYILSLDKKVAEEEKKKLAVLLMLGRSFGVHMFLCMQRLDAAYIQSRDCLGLVLALGNLSEEGKEMMFHDYKKQMEPNRRQGTGYFIINGTNFTPFVVPQVTDHELLNDYIKRAVQRELPPACEA